MSVKTFVYLSLTLIIGTCLLIALALIIGSQQSGEHVAAFTANNYKTRSMYIFDSGYGFNFYIEISGHENELPDWSTATRGIIFYPRSQLTEPPNKP